MTSTVSFKDKLKQIISVILWDLKGCKGSLMVYGILASVATVSGRYICDNRFAYINLFHYLYGADFFIYAQQAQGGFLRFTSNQQSKTFPC